MCCGVGDHSGSDVCQQNCGGECATGGYGAAHYRRGQEMAQRRRCSPQSRIQGSPAAPAQDARLASPAAGGMRSAEIRCRKTQYVQPWYTIVNGTKSVAAHVMIFSV